MRYRQVLCLDDLLRDSYWQAKSFIYDLLRYPIHQACGLNIAASPRFGGASNMLPGFEAQRFVQLAMIGCAPHDWQMRYFKLPDDAASYLSAHLPEETLVLGYEMPPWLKRACEENGLDWLDIRMSPLRFGEDLMLAMKSNRRELRLALAKFAIGEQDVLSRANQLQAQVRLRHRHAIKAAYTKPTVIYVGQTVADTSLVLPSGQFARIHQFAQQLLTFCGGRPLHYKPHPAGGAFAKTEMEMISAILGQPVSTCSEEAYELIASDWPVSFIGLSSGLLQEAICFGKETLSLLGPVSPVGLPSEAHLDDSGFLQIESHTALSSAIWREVLDGPSDQAELVVPFRPNLLRELHNTWWGFATHVFRHSDFYGQLGGHIGRQIKQQTGLQENLQARLQNLEQELKATQEAMRLLLRQFTPQTEVFSRAQE